MFRVSIASWEPRSLWKTHGNLSHPGKVFENLNLPISWEILEMCENSEVDFTHLDRDLEI